MPVFLFRIGLAAAISVSAATPGLADCPLVASAIHDASRALAPPREQAAWETCLDDAADRLSPQSEPAGIVVNEAFAACARFEHAVRHEIGEENCQPGYGLIGPLRKQVLEPRLFGRVMTWRAARIGRGSHR